MLKREIIKKWKSGNGYRFLLKCQNCGDFFEKTKRNLDFDKCYFCSTKCSNSHKEVIEKIKKLKFTRYEKSLLETGYAFSEEKRLNMSKGQKGKAVWNKGKNGKEMPNWQGGISFEPYGIEFNGKLKEVIKKRDNYTCKGCGLITENLSIHHIDYDKKNNNSNNLISLCKKCHGKTNFKRKDWERHFKNLVDDIC